ncbi:MAG: biotin/lipoyl-binding protein, partial [Moorea sp. SIO4A3]|nr:biotin/lipoyl-binding protein [Moorena sp. SIO4A3]
MSEPSKPENKPAEIDSRSSLGDIALTVNRPSNWLTKKRALIIMTLLIGNILYWNRGLITNHPVTTATESRPEIKTLPRILPVEAMAVKPVISYQVSRVYTGEVTARRTTELGFERGGKLTQILVEEGDFVIKNQALAYLDTGNLQNTLRQLTFQKEGEVAKLQEMEAGPRSQTIAAARAAVKDLGEQLQLALTKNTRRKNLYTKTQKYELKSTPIDQIVCMLLR